MNYLARFSVLLISFVLFPWYSYSNVEAISDATDMVYTSKYTYISDIVVRKGEHWSDPCDFGYSVYPIDLNKNSGGDFIYLCVQRGGSSRVYALEIVQGKNADCRSQWEMESVDLNSRAGGEYLYLCKLRRNLVTQKDPYTGKKIGDAITDIRVYATKENNQKPLAGFTKIPVDLNKGAGGDYIYLYYRTSATDTWVTGVNVISGSNSSITCQNGWSKIPVDLNEGSGGKFIYLCYKEAKNVTGISTLNAVTGKGKKCPSTYTTINMDLNVGSGGEYVYLCYAKGGGYIADIQIFSTNFEQRGTIQIPTGYQRVNKDLNSGAHGKYIYIYYRQR